MNNEQRRIEILSALKESASPISASAFAKDFSVTRQIIVADIALLRASGYPIRAEHKGYVLEKIESNEIRKRIKVLEQQVRAKMQELLQSKAKMLNENLIVIAHL